MAKVIQKYNKGTRRKANPTYTKVRNTMAKVNSLSEKLALRQELRKYPVGDPMDPNFIRVNYVRFADDFLIGIIGPLKLAEHIKDLVSKFLGKLELELSESKTLITKASEKPAKYLGAEIMWKQVPEKKVVLT